MHVSAADGSYILILSWRFGSMVPTRKYKITTDNHDLASMKRKKAITILFKRTPFFLLYVGRFQEPEIEREEKSRCSNKLMECNETEWKVESKKYTKPYTVEHIWHRPNRQETEVRKKAKKRLEINIKSPIIYRFFLSCSSVNVLATRADRKIVFL